MRLLVSSAFGRLPRRWWRIWRPSARQANGSTEDAADRDTHCGTRPIGASRLHGALRSAFTERLMAQPRETEAERRAATRAERRPDECPTGRAVDTRIDPREGGRNRRARKLWITVRQRLRPNGKGHHQRNRCRREASDLAVHVSDVLPAVSHLAEARAQRDLVDACSPDRPDPAQPSSEERMTQRMRNIIANVLLGVGTLTIVVFVASHFMTQERPSWRKDLVWLGLASVIASGAVRGRRRGAAQDSD